MNDPKLTPKEFIEKMAESDSLITEEERERDGLSYNIYAGAEVAREMLKNEDWDVSKWCELARKRWQEGKFYKLWQEETKAGRDPHKAFADRGWEP